MLVNAYTIVKNKLKSVTYFHAELAQHDVLLAEGLLAETYLGTGQRAKFAGGTDVALHPDFSAPAWEMARCAPLLQPGRGWRRCARLWRDCLGAGVPVEAGMTLPGSGRRF